MAKKLDKTPTTLDFVNDVVFDATEVTYVDDTADVEELDLDTMPSGFLEHSSNLAAFIPEDELHSLAEYCDHKYQEDLESVSEHFENIKRGVENIGVKIEELDEPFPGACSVQHPLVLESSLKMQAKIMGEIFNGRPLVDVRLGSGAEQDVVLKAKRAANYMNYQLMTQMGEYVEETERMALRYAMTGASFRRFWYDENLMRVVSKTLREDQLIYNSDQATLGLIPFYTELDCHDDYDFKARIASGEFVSPVDDPMPTDAQIQSKLEETYVQEAVFGTTGEPSGVSPTEEKHSVRWHYLKYKFEDPYNEGVQTALPYAVCVHVATNKVIAVYRNWASSDPARTPLVWHSQYRLVPSLGGLGWGYIQLLGNPQMALTLMLRSVIDAGQFSNLQGGIKDSKLRFVNQSSLPIAPGTFLDVDTTQATVPDLDKGFVPFDFKEPSQVLERLIGALDSRIQRFADSTESVIGDSTNYGPVGTTVALIEASAKFHNDILKRFNRSLETEFKILKQINKQTLQPNTQFFWKGQLHTVNPEDFDDQIEFIPSADPTFSSQAQRLQRANMKIQTARLNPELHDLREAYISFYREVGLEEDEINRLLPPPGEAVLQDPMSDVIAVTKGKPIAAFPGQNHQAHIDFKTAFLADPKAGANPAYAAYVPLIQANIIEHGLMQYQEQLQELMGNAAQSPEVEMAQAQAAATLQKLNQLAVNDELMAAGDPAVLLANVESEKLKLAKEKLELDKVRLELERAVKERTLNQKDEEVEIKKAEAGVKASVEDKKLQLDALKLGVQLRSPPGTRTE